ncbi:Smr/MutS family protein [Bartonella tamiae]|uniref:Smr domain-containing protein n=1 Tax=Bartonella tamiae Th239 TaxID=1094558 RepID=J0QYN3_9HYPH|nr:Smr/MutS family protein [Bartonella tamiae]EJF91221.1 hypothetical protein ME5_00553 [Bartonella tamiae Th239]EJF93114.1 hypothetical protein MEG_01328 [Bartonella tamiae Th307]
MTRKGSNDKTYPLNVHDRILWDAVKRTATPLHHLEETQKDNNVFVTGFYDFRDKTKIIKPDPSKNNKEVLTKNTRSVNPLHPLDKTTQRKLAKGRLHIEGRVDLHGLYQEEAYSLLLSFLNSAHQKALRYVLVITGKGRSSGGNGVLRQSVPQWLSTAPFRQYVVSYEDAALTHGGKGALYIRLRRNVNGKD